MRTPALYALLFFAGGIILATNCAIPAMAYFGAAVIAAALAVILHLAQRTVISRLLICLSLFATGGFLTELQSAEFPANHVSNFASAGERMTVAGLIVSEPDIRPDKTFLTVQVDSLRYRDRAIASCGRLRLQVQQPTSAFGYRDRIRFSGFVNQPQTGRNPGAFDYRRYLAIRQISATVTVPNASRIELLQSGASEPFVRAVVMPIRDYISAVFEKFLPPDDAAMMKGFLIGDVRYISRDVYQRFKDTGTLHVLAASGANVGYVVATLLVVIKLFRLPRQYRLYILLAGVVVFSFLAYNQPSVVRASVMAVVALIGMSLYRDANWPNTIAVAALIILAFRPLYLFDLGWQLSFSAAFALILFLPAVERFLPKPKGIVRKIARYFLLIFYGSIIAQLGVLPIMIYNFHSVPLVSFLANLVIVPLVGVAASVGIVLVFVSAIPVISTLVGDALSLTLDLTVWAIDYFESLPIPQLRLAAPQLLLIISYYLGLQLLFSLAARKKLTPVFVVLLLVCLNTLLWRNVLAGGAETRLTFLDTRELTTAVIDQEGGRKTLINGGGSNVVGDRGESTVLPFLLSQGITSLDRLCATTERYGNRQSLQSVVAGLEHGAGRKTTANRAVDLLPGQVERLDSIVVVTIEGSVIALLTAAVPVHLLNNFPDSIAIVAADWRYLQQPEFANFLRSHHVETAVVSSYPSTYTNTDDLRILRKTLPGTRIHSTLESGGISISLGTQGHRVETTVND